MGLMLGKKNPIASGIIDLLFLEAVLEKLCLLFEEIHA